MTNKPTEKETEFLGLLQEEGAEVIQISSKINRFGWESFHPEDENKITNRIHLEREIGDMLAIVEILTSRGIISKSNIDENVIIKLKRLKALGII